jgi:Predicted endonuclease containing a URI domain
LYRGFPFHDRSYAQTLVRLPGPRRQRCAVLRHQRRCAAALCRASAWTRRAFFHSSPAQALVYVEACASKGDALRREIAIKRLDKRAKERLVALAAPLA